MNNTKVVQHSNTPNIPNKRVLQAFAVRENKGLVIKVYEGEQGLVATFDGAPGAALTALTAFADQERRLDQDIELKMKYVRAFPS